MEDKILIVGAGNIGSRYLQGLLEFKTPLIIFVYDVYPAAFDLCGDRYGDEERSIHKIIYVTEFKKVPEHINIAVISTTADKRTQVVQKISENFSIDYWVLEKVLAQKVSDLHLLRDATKKSKATWVNTSLYLQPLYQKLNDQKSNEQAITFIVDKLSGLACNAIHYIDYVQRWNNSKITEFNTSKLNYNWYPAKRKGFFEVEGQLEVSFSDSSRLIISGSHNDISHEVELIIADEIWKVNEADGIAKSLTGKSISAKAPHQSEMTAPLFKQILLYGRCNLPNISLSIIQHEIMIKSFLEHWNKKMPLNQEVLPIT